MLLLNILLPLFSAIIAGLFSRLLGRKGAMLLSSIFILFTFLLSICNFSRLYFKNNFFFVVDALTWIDFGHIKVNWIFLFDSLSLWMMIVVSLISLCVHVYSVAYMGNDPHQPRFFSYLSLFTFFMLILVSAGNYLQLFVGWEGVGLCSYLLIAFWYNRIAANKAALKAIFLNRIGDLAFVIAMLLILYVFESLDFAIILQRIEYLNYTNFIFFSTQFNIFVLICTFFFIGAVGKSAQIGLHTWLPDAMEGPTPVSALIHSATMVTAGVFLIIRSSFLFEYAENVLLIVVFIGALTSFFAASAGLLQNDIKKIIAYSTCSQLGYMIFACGLSAYHVSFFHLVNHAFFKALLFLCAGSIIHALNDEQDIRKMGGLVNFMPFTYIVMLIGSLSLAGFPFLTGFYSKDFILEVAFVTITPTGLFSYWLGMITVFFTAYYSFRILFLVFFINPQGYKINYITIHEVSWHMGLPMFFLALGSIFFGFFFKDLFIGLGSDFFLDSIYILPEHSDNIILAEYVSVFVKNLPFFFSILALFTVYFFEFVIFKFVLKFKLSYIGRVLVVFFNKKWFFDLIYNEFIGIPFLKNCYFMVFQPLDKGFLEYIGPFGIAKVTENLARAFSRLHTGHISQYLFFFFLFLYCVLFVWNFFIIYGF